MPNNLLSSSHLLWLLLSLLVLSNAQAESASTQQLVDQVCAHCHGSNGEGSNAIYPRLAGQHEKYMVKQLTDFREKRRIGTMNEMAANLTDKQIQSLASFFSAKPVLSHKVRNKDLAAVGKYIFHRGNPYTDVPACSSCHGDNGAGTDSLPRLAGQHKRYISVQLEEFNSRKRNNDNAIMHTVASKLSELEREAVALYASGLK